MKLVVLKFQSFKLPHSLWSLRDQSQFKMPGPDPYGDIDFEEINEATGLAADEIKCLKVVKNIYYRKKNHFFNL